MHRPAFALLMLAMLAACASAPPGADEDHATMDIIGHHCDGSQGIDSIAVHVDKPGVAVIHWDNRKVCGDPA